MRETILSHASVRRQHGLIADLDFIGYRVVVKDGLYSSIRWAGKVKDRRPLSPKVVRGAAYAICVRPKRHGR